MQYEFELVGKIGSMALIRQEDNDIDYNIFSRLGMELRPGMIWVSSGAAEIGRLDFMKRTVRELQKGCVGASRAGANGAFAKLEYALGPVSRGTTVIIGHARHRISRLLSGEAPCTRIGVY